MPTRLLNPRFYYVAVALVAGLFLASLLGRHLHFDDAWSAEEAFWLRRDGYVHTELFRGFGGWENRLYIFHKGYIYVMAAVLSVLGESVWAVKSVALLAALGGLALLLRYFRGQAEAQWLAALLYLGCGTLMLYGFAGRPETLVMLCGLASYVVLCQAGSRAGRLAAAGALAGLAGLVHPNGTIYMAAGALWLLWRGAGWRALLWYAVPSGLVLSLFVLDAVVAGELPVLIDQFVHYPVVAPNLHLADKLRVMGRYYSIFLHSEGEIPLTVLLLLALGLAGLGQRAVAGARPILTPVLRYTLLLLGLFWVLTKSPTAYYFLLFVPFFVIYIVETALGPALARPYRLVLAGLLLLYPVGTAVRYAFVQKLNRQGPPDAAAENARLAALMPRHGAKVIAPLHFIFGQLDNYQIRGLTFLAPAGAPLDTVFARAAADTVQYIIADYNTSNDVYHISPDAPARVGRYRRVSQNAWHGLYVRQPAD